MSDWSDYDQPFSCTYMYVVYTCLPSYTTPLVGLYIEIAYLNSLENYYAVELLIYHTCRWGFEARIYHITKS